jgi:hypothetical protein
MAATGAELAISSVIKFIRGARAEGRADFTSLLCDAANAARESLAGEAERAGNEIKDYACTLLIALITHSGGGALQIGDGAIIARDETGGWAWVFWPQRGEFANTTFFLTDVHALNQLTTDELPNAITEVALMSDGLEPLALVYSTRQVHEPFMNGMFQPLLASTGDDVAGVSVSLGAFLGSERVAARTDDDVTIVMATRRPLGPGQ